MKNNYGFGKFEVATVIVLMFVLIAFLMHCVLGINNSLKEKCKKFRDDAFQFNKTVFTNIDSFKNDRIVYLGEVLEEQLLEKMSSPFSSNQCDVEESKVENKDVSERYVTFRCDDYLIDHELSTDLTSAPIYKVSKWDDNKITGDNVESKELYNCYDGEKEIFDYYLEKDYFVSQINKHYSQNHLDLNTITDDVCKIERKTFYRTKEVVKEK